MQTRLTRKPGQKGTKALHAEYGERLVCVRYKYDARKLKRYKTVELIVEERAWRPRFKPETIVLVSVRFNEGHIARKFKLAGGRWNQTEKLWEMHYDLAERLGAVERIVGVKDGRL